MMMDSIVRIKWKIRDLLDQKGMSYYELSNKADLTGACISNWYSKRNYTPSLDAIIKVCKVLDISLAELFKEKYFNNNKLKIRLWEKLLVLT